MIRIFPDFSVQVTAAPGAPPEPGAARSAGANGSHQHNVPGVSSYQQRGASRPISACPAPCPPDLNLSLQALRKEKSRDAARSRRGKENFEFYELAKLLPLPAAITSQLDKASIIRLTISYLKMRDFAGQGDPPWNLRIEGPPPNTSVKVIGSQRRRSPSSVAMDIFESHMGSHILQVELTGSSMFDYVHPGDHVEMAEQLGMKLPPGRGLLSQSANDDGASSASSSSQSETPEPVEATSPGILPQDNSLERSFFIRMKSTLTKRGVHIKSSGYKVIHVTGRLRLRVSLSHGRSGAGQVMGLVVVAHALPPPTINEVRIDCHMFVTRVNLDLNIIYCENRISDYMDLNAVDLMGKRCYHFIHAEDVEGIRHSHLDLLNKGQCVTKYYRWMQKNGGYIWVQSCATISINAKNATERNIIWVNYILSLQEYKDIPMDIAQLPHLPEKTSESSETSDSDSDSKDNSEDNENPKSDGKGNHSEQSEDHEPDHKQPGPHSDPDMNCDEEGNSSSDACSEESEESEDCELRKAEEVMEQGGLSALGGIGALDALGPMHIKVERYAESETDMRGPDSLSSDSAKDSESGDEDEDDSGVRVAGVLNRHQRRKRRRRKGAGPCGGRRRRLSGGSSPGAIESSLGDPPRLLPSTPPPTGACSSSSVLKIKTEMSEPINFDNDSSIWNFPPNREISRNESPYSMTKPPTGGEHFSPSPSSSAAPPALHVSIPDSVLTPPGGAEGAGRNKPQFAGLATVSSDPLSPPLSASPREKPPQTSGPSNSLLYAGELEALQRLQAGNVVLPLVHRVAGTLAATGSSGQRVYTTGTIRYAPAEVTLGNLLPNTHPVNFVDVNGPGFGLDPKTPMEMLYHHVHRLNMSGPFGGAVTGAGLTQVPAASVFTTAEGIFSSLPFPVYSNGIHAAQTLERKED
ncbi:neuronal PAS domain-containing protein 3 isoform X4 [Xenopus tropicalis]|uniref:Neuronal PAS domain-containing protein 3 isoform X4 n=1 Tax=Xenopus tropicalis TaxID=8364 RepID=A0A8J0SWJ0_XENTR|nr:neuronal PAS domain-containing protein 3 isoform X4 [Xenopus tropicalis]